MLEQEVQDLKTKLNKARDAEKDKYVQPQIEHDRDERDLEKQIDDEEEIEEEQEEDENIKEQIHVEEDEEQDDMVEEEEEEEE